MSAKEAEMATTVITLTVSPVASRNVPPVATNLGNMIVSTDDITDINGDTSLRGQHSGFCVRVRLPNWWLCRAGYIRPGIPGHQLFPNGGQLHARGLLDFNQPTGAVAITGGTGDYSASPYYLHVAIVRESR
jgi:hypothetical protein